MKLHCDIQLPASKSESNRALMIAAYGGFRLDVLNLSDSRDTKLLEESLEGCRERRNIDIADCGTAARFMATFLACHEGDWLLTGSERMKQRPIKPLVDALLQLGADIQYVENEGFLPLHIHGCPIRGGKVVLEMSLSSQFASSLLLAAPMWPEGIEVELLGNPNSIPYLEMTMAMMRHFSAVVEWEGNLIKVAPKPYQPNTFVVSPDWSAASYWYEMAAFSEECEIKLSSLSLSKGRPNLQGDSIIAEWMNLLGVITTQDNDPLILTKTYPDDEPIVLDFYNNPDLFPTIAATCAGLRRKACFLGLRNLHFKESDRVGAMKKELARIGVELRSINDDEVLLEPASNLPFYEAPNPLQFASHDDHRIVMALAPLALKIGHVTFDHPEVVAKSYPGFWEKIGKILPIF